jgi:hypothetical protein
MFPPSVPPALRIEATSALRRDGIVDTHTAALLMEHGVDVDNLERAYERRNHQTTAQETPLNG